MGRVNAPFQAFNRGLVSPKALARVDLDRTRLSAETYVNWLPKTQGAMMLRPGTKYFGSSYSDSGAAWIEFVASTEDTALLELTNGRMRIWLGSDSHELALLERPVVATTVAINDTGWDDISTGGTASTSSVDAIPLMTGATTSGVTITASSQNGVNYAWKVGDKNTGTYWTDTGVFEGGTLPSWLKVDFGSGNTSTIGSYAITASGSGSLDNVPRSWFFQGNDVDTGSDASWTNLDTGGDQTGWSAFERRTFTVPSPAAYRFYRLYVTEITGGGDASGEIALPELELFPTTINSKVTFNSSNIVMNSSSVGAISKILRRVVVDTGDVNVEHSLVITVDRGPLKLRVGSSSQDDDYVSEASISSGYHNLAFVPTGNFYIYMESQSLTNKIIGNISIGASGVTSITAPWDANDLDNVRYDQSADVVYVDCLDVPPKKIERRGTGRSWSIVDYAPDNGPFFPVASSTAKLFPSYFYGNTRIESDTPFFSSDHVGSLLRLFHDGQSGIWPLGAKDAVSDPIEMTGLSDTGTPGDSSERRVVFSAAGTYTGTITIERSIDSKDYGFKTVSTQITTPTDTGTFTKTIDDPDDNLKCWYRAKLSSYTSGVALITATYAGGGVTGIARVTGYNSNTSVDVEVLKRFSDTGPTSNWQEGYWSEAQSFPTAVCLHGGRLAHAVGGNIFLSVADDYENFDGSTLGDAAPIIRTLGSGPVDNIYYLVSLLRLIVGTAGAELALRSSSIDEPLTAQNSGARTFSTQGSKNMRAVKMDTRAIFVQRSGQRVFMVGFGVKGDGLSDYEGIELTLLVPDLLAAGIVDISIQRQPDTRIHFALADGTVAILTYEPQEEVICWSKWETDGAVERVMSLPGTTEDAVYYHIRRTINGVTKRYLEKWALEADCIGDTGLSWLADCAKSYTDTGRSATLTGFSHLAGEQLIVWADDTGQSTAGKDLSPDVNGVQTTYLVNTGAGTVTLNSAVHHAVAGLPYSATWKSAKLAYGAEGGSALAQMKRLAQIAFVLYQTHNNGLFFGGDTGNLDALPRMINGASVDPDAIFETFDQAAMVFPGTNNTDARIYLKAKAPRPAMVLAAIPSVQTNERI